MPYVHGHNLFINTEAIQAATLQPVNSGTVWRISVLFFNGERTTFSFDDHAEAHSMFEMIRIMADPGSLESEEL